MSLWGQFLSASTVPLEGQNKKLSVDCANTQFKLWFAQQEHKQSLLKPWDAK